MSHMRVIVCDGTGELPRPLRLEARHRLEHLGEEWRRLEAADVDVTRVQRGAVEERRVEVTLHVRGTPSIRASAAGREYVDAFELALHDVLRHAYGLGAPR